VVKNVTPGSTLFPSSNSTDKSQRTNDCLRQASSNVGSYRSVLAGILSRDGFSADVFSTDISRNSTDKFESSTDKSNIKSGINNFSKFKEKKRAPPCSSNEEKRKKTKRVPYVVEGGNPQSSYSVATGDAGQQQQQQDP
jgi:hypothetical protein